MPREIDTAVRRFVEAERSGDVVLAFVTIEHDDLDRPIRMVRDTKDYRLGGEFYRGAYFDLTVLTDGEDQPRARLTIPNVDLTVSEAIEGLTTSPVISIAFYSSADFNLAADPRVPSGTPSRFYFAAGMTFEKIDVDTLQASGDLIVRDYGAEPYGRRATQGRFPALFRGP